MHYYSENPEVKSEEREYKVLLKEHSFSFTTDNGVFSKDGLDFGSRLLIETYENPQTKGNLVDLGCGIGVVGIALGRLYKRPTIMIDVNVRAINLAKRNASKNDLDAQCFLNDGLKGVEGKAAVVVTNPPIRAGKKVVYSFFEEAFNFLVTKGELWVVIRKQHGALSALEKIEEIFGEAQIVKKKNGFFIIKAIKL